MDERIICIPLPAVYPGASAALGANYAYFTMPCNGTLLYVSAAGAADDTGLALDVNDDGTAIVSAVDCADASAPGTWKSRHYGGSNDPVEIARGSVMSLTAANAANGNTIVGFMLVALGEDKGHS